MRPSQFRSLIVICALCFTSLCLRAQQTVVLYTSVDEPYVRPLVRRFQDQTGIKVICVTDAEATKTTGLAEKLAAEKANPKADVFWNNEIFHTINLAGSGHFAPYASPRAADIPARWKDKDHLYTDIGLRARMIARSTRPQFHDATANLTGVQSLAHPALKGKIALCHPGFGTASGHFAALYIILGEPRYRDLLSSLKANDIKLLGGNSVVAEQISAGNIAAGLTDSDDVNNAIHEGEPLTGILPDQDSFGTLLIPTTISLVKGAPHPDNARQLIDFLLDPAIEKQLIADRYLAYSTRDVDQHVKSINADYTTIARHMRKAVEIALLILQQRPQ